MAILLVKIHLVFSLVAYTRFKLIKPHNKIKPRLGRAGHLAS